MAACPAFAAQEIKQTGFVTIKVMDELGGAVTNAEVRFVERLSKEKNVRATDETGSAVVELAAGDYEVSVTSPGFQSLVIHFLEVRPGEHKQSNVVLKVWHSGGGDPAPPFYEPELVEPKSLEIKDLKLFAWQNVHKKRKYVEVESFRESRELHLIPSNKFDVTCNVVGGLDVLTGDYFLWTTVDFLVAPVTLAYEQMNNNELGSSVGWGQAMEMRDLKSVPFYFLGPDEVRQVAVKDLDLSTVLAAFPVGDAGELWPWLVRVTVHVQDRSGKQIAVAERTFRLSPTSARKANHYNDPLPTR
jgi:hypothetical protein